MVSEEISISLIDMGKANRRRTIAHYRLVTTVELERAWTYHPDVAVFNARELAKNPISLIPDGLNLLCRGTSSEQAGLLPSPLRRFSPSQFAFG